MKTKLVALVYLNIMLKRQYLRKVLAIALNFGETFLNH